MLFKFNFLIFSMLIAGCSSQPQSKKDANSGGNAEPQNSDSGKNQTSQPSKYQSSNDSKSKQPISDDNIKPSGPIPSGMMNITELELTNGVDLTGTNYIAFRSEIMYPGNVGSPNGATPDCITLSLDRPIDSDLGAKLALAIKVQEGVKWIALGMDNHDLNFDIKNGKLYYPTKDNGKYLGGIMMTSVDTSVSLSESIRRVAGSYPKIQYVRRCNF